MHCIVFSRLSRSQYSTGGYTYIPGPACERCNGNARYIYREREFGGGVASRQLGGSGVLGGHSQGFCVRPHVFVETLERSRPGSYNGPMVSVLTPSYRDLVLSKAREAKEDTIVYTFRTTENSALKGTNHPLLIPFCVGMPRGLPASPRYFVVLGVLGCLLFLFQCRV